MPDRAHVTSLEAIEHFRAKLLLYRDKAGRVLDEVGDEVVRTRLWLENERPAHWEAQLRRLGRELEQRQQELFSAQLSGLREASARQQAAVQKAKQAIREAEEKLRVVRHWRRQFDHVVEPAARQVEKFRHTVGHEMGLAVAWLNDVIKTISDYAELSAARDRPGRGGPDAESAPASAEPSGDPGAAGGTPARQT
jgi:predicted  nucleic acid-binding Zn-ribbon protein